MDDISAQRGDALARGDTAMTADGQTNAVDTSYPPWGWSTCLAGLGAAFTGLLLILMLASLVIPRRAGHVQSASQLLWGLAATLLFDAVLAGIAVGLTTGRYGGGPRLLGWRPRRPSQWLGWSVLAVVLAWATLGLYAAVTALPGLHGFQPGSNVPNDLFTYRETRLAVVALTVVVAPVVEETFFRAFLFNGLRRSLGVAGAAAVSGLVFALAHFAVTLIIPFTVIGVIFAYAYHRTGTIWTNVGAHLLFNLVSVLATLAR